ncbi:vegetative cell wall protein gp1 [Oryza brachyantha]|uniref:vegetative cell wall protein gp1 n=1 Tax=Oryza brachyantha TaxID=4533 RepID=UPI001ADC165D|nr:vegetative cell wall protein gp1 [Oryza brachyantha]
MLVAALRVPAPIPSSLAAPARPLLRRHLPPAASMASSPPPPDAGATNKPAPAPAPVPQPPEKPLPGDCCGSGCVRCVWDVYYDELDAYNKALAAHSSPAASSSSDSGSNAATTTGDGAKS